MFNFQKLEVYQLSKELVVFTYSLTKQFPETEKFCIVSQMNRSAVSIASNIAEGMSRSTQKDKLHFINIAYSSMMELTCQFDISHDLGYITQDSLDLFFHKSKNLAVKMSNLAKTLKQ